MPRDQHAACTFAACDRRGGRFAAKDLVPGESGEGPELRVRIPARPRRRRGKRGGGLRERGVRDRSGDRAAPREIPGRSAFSSLHFSALDRVNSI